MKLSINNKVKKVPQQQKCTFHKCLVVPKAPLRGLLSQKGKALVCDDGTTQGMAKINSLMSPMQGWFVSFPEISMLSWHANSLA